MSKFWRNLLMIIIAACIGLWLFSTYGCNKSLEPLPEEEATKSGIDTVWVDTTIEYPDFTWPDTTYWNMPAGIEPVFVDNNQAHHPCCPNPWSCAIDPGIPSVSPFYAADNITETLYRVIWSNKQDFMGVEIAYLDGNGVYQQGACDTTLFIGGETSHSADCHINPPFTCP